MTIEPDITSRMHQSSNPWNVSDASVFLKYCCPECDYINLSLPEFSDHALENHAQSIALFDPTDNQGYKNRYNLPLYFKFVERFSEWKKIFQMCQKSDTV